MILDVTPLKEIIWLWREKNQQDATIRCLLLTSISTCFGASLCPSSGEQRTRYCIWCIVLVLLDVVGRGCGALSWRMWALWRVLTRGCIWRTRCIVCDKLLTHRQSFWITLYNLSALNLQYLADRRKYLFLLEFQVLKQAIYKHGKGVKYGKKCSYLLLQNTRNFKT
jgi:hypothetical protein